ncbi:MAG: DNA cytosine methyltransferase [Planctomycetaceae bacterium]
MLKAIDLYCGAGGTTEGAEQLGVRVHLAVNHWVPAIYTHRSNHRDTEHICATIDAVDPQEFVGRGINFIMASPECTHHSRARGGRPVNDQKRSGGWEVAEWVRVLEPEWLLVENVSEWEDWGPLGADDRPIKSRKGEEFRAWVQRLRSWGYRVEWRHLNAADFGAPTSRVRLFVLARNAGGPIKWPVPTHGKDGKPLPWRAAAEVIDWSRPCPSIFFREEIGRRPLADKTLRRIEIGVRKFAGAAHLVKFRGTSTVSGLSAPMPTLTAGGHHNGLAVPFLLPRQGFYDSRTLKRPRSLMEPLPTITASHAPGHLCVPFLVNVNHGDARHRGGRTASLADPLGTITAHNGRALVTPFMVKYHGGDSEGKFARFVDPSGPFPVIDTQPRFGMAYPFLVPNFGEREGQAPRARSLFDPVPTVTSHGAGCLAVPFTMSTHGGGVPRSAADPVATITCRGGAHVVIPWISSYYGTNNMHGLHEPVYTITAKGRHALVAAALAEGNGAAMVKLLGRHRQHSDAMRRLLVTMWKYGVVDIGFRMLDIDELLIAQGFPAGYELFGTKEEMNRLIGNSVSPPMAKALVGAIMDAHVAA